MPHACLSVARLAERQAVQAAAERQAVQAAASAAVVKSPAEGPLRAGGGGTVVCQGCLEATAAARGRRSLEGT